MEDPQPHFLFVDVISKAFLSLVVGIGHLVMWHLIKAGPLRSDLPTIARTYYIASTTSYTSPSRYGQTVGGRLIYCKSKRWSKVIAPSFQKHRANFTARIPTETEITFPCRDIKLFQMADKTEMHNCPPSIASAVQHYFILQYDLVEVSAMSGMEDPQPHFLSVGVMSWSKAFHIACCWNRYLGHLVMWHLIKQDLCLRLLFCIRFCLKGKQ
ncbi:hypothetical protein CEXT_629771 [Caerostris extrusa]|uniref:Uncharacterized protein n=1 Tax=Caerostris extrusa TaxID=172846 RepID=A0AAV4P2I1_CAEEX|nr:hypothetical protein CEXT_629771 [Caerostris extrusa]